MAEKLNKKLGFGLMRLPLLDKDDDTSINFAESEKMTDLFFERGFTYCDTAWMYHSFKSEEAAGKFIVDRHPRENFTIATKMPCMMLKGADEPAKIFAEQKRRLHVDYFDYYLVHNMCSTNYEKVEKYNVLDFVREKRETGEIRCLGFSYHDSPEYLDELLTKHPFFEFVQLQINYVDWESAGIQAHKCYDVCVKHGKKVIVMEPVKGGILANLPQEAEKILRDVHPDWSPVSWAVRFAASLPEVIVVISGMSSLEQMEENTAFMQNFEPLSEEENAALLKAAEIIRKNPAIPCTSCRYCVEANKCPKNILIPTYFSLYNTLKLGEYKVWATEATQYDNYLHQGFGAASDCIACKMCEKVCPQHIDIHEWMPKIAAAMKL